MIRLTTALVAILLAASAAQAGDPAAGEKVFKRKCSPCHEIGEGAGTKVGPELNGLFGRPTGSVEGYDYTDANRNSGIVWSVETFSAYIRAPRQVIPGTAMNFVGLRSDKEVDDLVAYIGQFAPDGTVTGN